MWKFEADNIGKVSHAEISMAPLVLLVGRNNTGKSYIATLLWALTNAQMLIGRNMRAGRPDLYKSFVAKLLETEPAQIRITEQLANDLIESFNFELAQHGRGLLREVFSYDGFERTAVHVVPNRPFVSFGITLHSAETYEPDNRPPSSWRGIGSETLTIVDDDGSAPRIIPILPVVNASVVDRVLIEVIYRILLGPSARRQTIYIPAARTGLMLSLPMIITQLFDVEFTVKD